MGSRWIQRIAALTLGTALVPVVLAGLVLAESALASGRERCEDCLRVRAVDRRGLVWSSSEPGRDFLTPETPTDCAQHDWQRIGCWRTGLGYSRYGVR